MKGMPTKGFWPGYYTLGAVAAMAGDKDLAFACLELAHKFKYGLIPSISVDAQLDSLRDDPRFDELLKRSGF